MNESNRRPPTIDPAHGQQKAQLHSHPLSPDRAVQALWVSVEAIDESALRLVYTLSADMKLLKLPEPKPAARVDGLWKHSCFEVFMRRAGEASYLEYNFSPSGEWAAYRFRGYRELADDQDNLPVPESKVVRSPGQLQMEVRLALDDIPVGYQLGLSAVIESSDGDLSYWALRHCTEKPDFHHSDSFVLALNPSRTGKT